MRIPPSRKYRNRPTTIDGVRFASQREAKRYAELRLLEAHGVIANLRLQVRFPLTVNGQFITHYIADFVYYSPETGRDVVEDAKGVRTPVYVLKRKLLLALRGIEIREV